MIGLVVDLSVATFALMVMLNNPCNSLFFGITLGVIMERYVFGKGKK